MFFAPLLKLRDQIARKRNQLTMDEEKPFLSHLEDLRKTLTRMILTLITGVILCFAFNEWFFAIVRDPLRRAGLEAPRERNLPAVVAALPESQQQPTWWRIHNAARGAAALEGPQRQLFLDSVAPTPLDRQLTNAVLLHHTASILPEADRKAYLAKATALLIPAEDGPKVLEFTAQLVAAKTSPDLDVPADMVETEAFAPAESFMLSMKLSLVAGIIICFPLLFYFLLEFILPGLTDRERRLLWPSLVIGFGLFLSGVLFAFYFVVPRALEFFHEYSNSLGIRDRWRIGQYISFVTTFSLIFGLAFELPVVVMAMVKLGLLESTTMRRTRSWAVVIILAASAILTPTGDMLTMSMLAGPMIIMYEACIWLAVLHEKKERQREEAERANDMARRAALVGVGITAVRAWTEDSPAEKFEQSTQVFLEGALRHGGLPAADAERAAHRLRDVNDDFFGAGHSIAAIAARTGDEPGQVIANLARLGDDRLGDFVKRSLAVHDNGEAVRDAQAKVAEGKAKPEDIPAFRLNERELARLVDEYRAVVG
jgi:sec-independent protein translocase protein TatC